MSPSAHNEYKQGGDGDVVTRCVDQLEYEASPLLAAPHGFSTRIGGVSTGIFTSLNLGHRRGDDPENVRENYRRFCAATGTDAAAIVMTNQVHGSEVKVVTRADVKPDLLAPTPFEADALATNAPGVTLCIFSADCIPVLLFDPVKRAVAAAHAGWRGTAAAIAAAAVETLKREYGSDPTDLRAAIGPGIGPCCFETDGDVPAAMTAALGGLAEPFMTRTGEKWNVDLKAINAAILARSGLLREHIDVSQECTCCAHDRFWSHRYTKGERGSQAAVIMLEQ